eukprot:14906815-Ditylum_brightwellii.AAC.1
MGAQSYTDRILTPEAILEAVKHSYDMKTHKVVTNNTEIQMSNNHDGLKGFDDVEDHQSNDFKKNNETEETKELSEVGSYASQQAHKKARMIAAAPKMPTKNCEDDDNASLVVTEVTK